MKALIGLGNPGPEYESTRHNVGFLAMDRLQNVLNLSPFELKPRLKARISKARYKGKELLLIKPETYMNLSGEALKQIMNFYHLQPSDFWLFYDDFHLPLKMVRIRTTGSSAGHRGVESVMEQLSTDEIVRFRIGIHPRQRNIKDPKRFVLRPFNQTDMESMNKVLQVLPRLIDECLQHGVSNQTINVDHIEA